MSTKEDLKQKKHELCIELLKENPELGMKDVNIVIMEKLGERIAPAGFSKAKKALSETDAPAPKKEDAAEEVKVEKAPKKTTKKINEKPKDKEAPVELSLSEHKGSEDTIEASAQEKPEETVQEKVEEVEEEPEIPVEKYPFKIKIQIPNASTVYIAGSFNKWNKDEYRLEKSQDNWWVFDDELPEGEHFYKFVVNNREWFIDFDSETFTDPSGVSNKLLVEKP